MIRTFDNELFLPIATTSFDPCLVNCQIGIQQLFCAFYFRHIVFDCQNRVSFLQMFALGGFYNGFLKEKQTCQALQNTQKTYETFIEIVVDVRIKWLLTTNQRLLRAISLYEFEPIRRKLKAHFIFAVFGSSRTNFEDSDAHFSAVEYSVAYFLSIFGSTKVCFDQVWNQKTITHQGTGRHFESVQVVRHILTFVPPPRYTYTVTLNRETCRGGGEQVFNPGLMHKLISNNF